MECGFSKKGFYGFLFFYIITLLWLLFSTPFTVAEANLLFNTHFNLSTVLAQFFYKTLGDSVFIRIPFFLLSLASFFLFLEIAKSYFRDSNYIYFTLFLYIVTPGIFVSSVIVNYATIPIFLSLLFIYAHNRNIKSLQILSLVLLFFTNTAAFALYFAVAIYSYSKKEWWLTIISSALFLLSSVNETYPIDGIPKGHLLQLFGIYGAVLSPLFFIVALYTVYRIAIKKERDLLWYITAVTLAIATVLSIRQKIKITDFTPYFVIITPLIVSVYKDTVTVRLKRFRKIYTKACAAVVAVLLLETSAIVLHYPIYKLINKKIWLINTEIYTTAKKVKAYKKQKIKCIKNIKSKEKNLYKYYGIKSC